VDVLQQDYSVSVEGLVATFVTAPVSPTAGSQATFDASASLVGVGRVITNYAWDFGDGASSNSNAPTATHTYSSAGRYVVTLTLTDNLGAKASRTNLVVVQ
jgi:PKD repeat protein